MARSQCASSMRNALLVSRISGMLHFTSPPMSTPNRLRASLRMRLHATALVSNAAHATSLALGGAATSGNVGTLSVPMNELERRHD